MPRQLIGPSSNRAGVAETHDTSDSYQWWFIGWALLPIYVLVLSAMYHSPLAGQRRWVQGLLAAAAVAALYSLFTVPPLGVILLLGLYPSYRCVHGA
jgi:hypothetical protein